jgi:hypothetical protein
VVNQPGLLAVNAFPFATVTSIRNLDNGEEMDIGGKQMTPTTVDLPAGNYEVTLASPRSKTVTRKVTIAAGAEKTITEPFSNPEAAPLPDFGGGR